MLCVFHPNCNADPVCILSQCSQCIADPVFAMHVAHSVCGRQRALNLLQQLSCPSHILLSTFLNYKVYCAPFYFSSLCIFIFQHFLIQHLFLHLSCSLRSVQSPLFTLQTFIFLLFILFFRARQSYTSIKKWQ